GSLSHSVSNQPGARACFVGQGSGTQNVTLGSAITLGMLDIDQPNLNLSSQNGSLTFDTQAGTLAGAGDAVLLVRNVQGDSSHTIDVPLVLHNTLEVTNNCNGPLTLAEQSRRGRRRHR